MSSIWLPSGVGPGVPDVRARFAGCGAIESVPGKRFVNWGAGTLSCPCTEAKEIN